LHEFAAIAAFLTHSNPLVAHRPDYYVCLSSGLLPEPNTKIPVSPIKRLLFSRLLREKADVKTGGGLSFPRPCGYQLGLDKYLFFVLQCEL
jgi:hypothetical protein